MSLKNLFTSVILLLAPIPLLAGGIFEFGIKAGANFSTPTGVPSGYDISNDVGYTAGAYAQVGLGDLLAIGVDLVYENRSFVLTQTGVPDNTFNGSTGSLNIPIVLKIGLPLGFNLDLGYQLSQFVSKPDAFRAEAQSFAVAGLEWHPISRFRIGARFLPGLSAFDIEGVDDVSSNVSNLYVAFAIF